MNPRIVFACPVGSLLVRPVGFGLFLLGRFPAKGHQLVWLTHLVTDLVRKSVHVSRLIMLVAMAPDSEPLGAKFDFLQSPRSDSSSHRHDVAETPREFSPQSSVFRHDCGLIKVDADVHGHVHEHASFCAQVELHFGRQFDKPLAA